MKKKVFEINLVNYGIANRFPNNYIEIHKKLDTPQYYPLFLEILEHEKKHTDKGFSFVDIALDFKGFENKKLYRKFILTTPSSWIQFSPIYKNSKGKYFLDPMVLFFWIFSYWFFVALYGGILYIFDLI